MANLQRMSVRLSLEVKEYFEKESLRTGVSQSGLINLALEQYILTQKFASNFNKISTVAGNNSLENK